MTSLGPVEYEAVVIGAGFGGIRALWEVRKMGLSVKGFEAASDVGGTWYWNRYPGARTDSEAWVYVMNFAPELRDEWDYKERYPGQEDIQRYLCSIADRFDLRKHIQFNTRVQSAHFDEGGSVWKITTTDGQSTTCRYFIPASGPLSIARDPPFAGLKSFKGEKYISSQWPKNPVDFKGKRIAVVGTGATGVQIIPKIALVAESVTVFQRTPNYVLPGRNYTIDEHEAQDVRQNYASTWQQASHHGFGIAMKSPILTFQDKPDAERIKQVLDGGWEAGCFHFHSETFGDIFTNQESNDAVSQYICNKIRATVNDPATAEALCPKYPFLSKRPPCGHFYYEAYNRPNVELVDISNNPIDLNEKGIRTASGIEYEFDMIIFAIGFDAATGALTEMDVRGLQKKSLKDLWSMKVQTYAGILVPGFPNMFMVTGAQSPFGNVPVMIDSNVGWIGKALAYLRNHDLATMDVSGTAASAWSQHVEDVLEATILADSARATHSWFVGTNVPGKASNVLFYLGGLPNWYTWLDKESENGWPSMMFTPMTEAGVTHSAQTVVEGQSRAESTRA